MPTFVGQVHVEPGAVVHLFDYYLALEDGQIELLVEEPVRDTEQTWSVHQQDRAALGVELPPAFESDTLVISSGGAAEHCGEKSRTYEGSSWRLTRRRRLVYPASSLVESVSDTDRSREPRTRDSPARCA